MKQQIKIKINYSLGLETERILSTLKKIEWYREKGYFASLPYKIQEIIKNEGNEISPKVVIDALKQEFNQKVYDELSSLVYAEWGNVSGVLSENLEKNQLTLIPDLYNIIFTKYGVGGSYNLPDQIIINVNNKQADEICRTIVHEIFHINIEPLIEKYDIGHWEKERIVDLIFIKIMPEVGFIQKIPQEINIGEVDQAFNSYFPNLGKIIKTVAQS